MSDDSNSSSYFEFSERSSNSFQDLRKKAHESVVRNSKLNPWKSSLAILTDWLFILMLISVGHFFPHPLTYLITVVLIAGRQHALFILMHESAHYRLYNNRKWNDWVGNFLVSHPVFLRMESYRDNHLQHHRYTNTSKDPDWIRKKDSVEWQFPRKPWPLCWFFVRYALGYGIYEMFMILRILSGVSRQSLKRDRTKTLSQLGLYGAAAVLFSCFGLWQPFFFYWIVPLFTITPLIMRVRSIAEHFALRREHELNGSRNILCPWYERLCFAPHHINLHADHHLFPSVPFYNLPKLHRALLKIGDYRNNIYQNTSYFGLKRTSLLKDLLRGPRAQSKIEAGELESDQRNERRLPSLGREMGSAVSE